MKVSLINTCFQFLFLLRFFQHIYEIKGVRSGGSTCPPGFMPLDKVLRVLHQ